MKTSLMLEILTMAGLMSSSAFATPFDQLIPQDSNQAMAKTQGAEKANLAELLSNLQAGRKAIGCNFDFPSMTINGLVKAVIDANKDADVSEITAGGTKTDGAVCVVFKAEPKAAIAPDNGVPPVSARKP